MIAVALEGAGLRLGESRILHPLRLQIEAGECVAIIGPSGAGKTSLLRLIGTELRGVGRLALWGQDPWALSTRARQRLYLAYAQTRMLHGQTRYSVPSLFLDELPPELLLKLNRRPQPASPPSAAYGSGYATAQAEPAGGLRIGQNVEHAKFGLGVIVAAQGRGGDAQVQVNFGSAGMKWLALEYAKLKPV